MRRAVLAVAALTLAGCSAGPAAAQREEEITVFAAASLTEAFTVLGEQFEEANPGVTVTFSFAASSALAGQITDGAPADVFASASTVTMDDVVAAGGAVDPVVFATNSMAIAVPPANPGRVTGLEDLTDAAVMTAVCQPEVPCGSTAAAVFSKAGIAVTPVTLEPDVKAVLSKVRLGEVDAGLVYVTDLIAAGDGVTAVGIADDVNASTAYPIATLSRSGHAAVAEAFVAYVLSSAGTSALSDAGFSEP